MPESAYRFVPNPNAPEFFCHHLHEVEVIGSMTRFILVALRKAGEEVLGEPPFTVVMPNEAVGPGIALTWQRMPSGVLIPAVGHLVRNALSLH